MAWCPVDSGLLLSSGKDYRTFCWDTISGEVLTGAFHLLVHLIFFYGLLMVIFLVQVVCELPASSNWNFDVQWSPRIAGVLSTSSYDGRVNLYNIEVRKYQKVLSLL
jgi:protein transport protein SEC31